MPIVQASIERSDANPEQNWAVEKIISKFCSYPDSEEGIFILAGGLAIHDIHDRKHFVEKLASSDVNMFDQATIVATFQSQVYPAFVISSHWHRSRFILDKRK
ncbi:uncharacterized protein BJ212DRAFT_1307938 [Suillus subaureus]|uniref:Uncharacterized protein n=1 Tax=Suillus subaureus TaxID=48587 RepID=A0A9P7JJN6_9AGAM|nr:uncharacterized protein BJ212DRAFT_1307938 [Suillus subaureus]KAG1826736.1 hypothetical protein BJ212DRAFT_1307938 [Suillus subaureus]